MKKFALVITVLVVAVLSFWAGGRYAEERSAGSRPQEEPAPIGTIDGARDDTAVSLVPGTVQISAARQQLIGVKVSAVEKKPITYTLRLYGRVVPDETKIYRINASTDCWIRELSDATTGSVVRKNQVLAEALAPAYYNAQVTYLIALNNLDRIRQQLGGELRHQQADLANNQIRGAVQALQNLGITDAQTEELANTRQARPYLQVRSPTAGVVLSRKLTLNQWFKAGEEFYTISDIRRVWVYADVYEDEAMHMRPGMTVTVRHGQIGRTFSAKMGKVLPLFDPAARTLKVRIDVDNVRYDLRPDMFVDVEIPITMPPSLSVPAEAILDTGKRVIVYVDRGNGIFEPRRVKTGWNLGGQVEIIHGLAPGEKVVVSGNFLIDSESRMEIAAFGVAAEKSEETAPGGQASGTRASGKSRESEIQSGRERSWAELIDPATGKRGVKTGTSKSKQEVRDSPGQYPTSPEVVEWNGPEKAGAPPRDWSGWGKFPGADYLGIKRQPKDSRIKTPPEAEGGKPAEQEQGDPDDDPTSDTRDTATKTGLEKRPASDQPRPSAK